MTAERVLIEVYAALDGMVRDYTARRDRNNAIGQIPKADAYAAVAVHLKDLQNLIAPNIMQSVEMNALLAEIGREVAQAEANWPPMNSAHEAYAVMAEEVDELWQHVKTNQQRRDVPAMRKEALQVAAMAIRFVRDICDGGRAGK